MVEQGPVDVPTKLWTRLCRRAITRLCRYLKRVGADLESRMRRNRGARMVNAEVAGKRAIRGAISDEKPLCIPRDFEMKTAHRRRRQDYVARYVATNEEGVVRVHIELRVLPVRVPQADGEPLRHGRVPPRVLLAPTLG